MNSQSCPCKMDGYPPISVGPCTKYTISPGTFGTSLCGHCFCKFQWDFAPQPNYNDNYYDDTAHTLVDREGGCYYLGIDAPAIFNLPAVWEYDMRLFFISPIICTPGGATLTQQMWTVSCSGSF